MIGLPHVIGLVGFVPVQEIAGRPVSLATVMGQREQARVKLLDNQEVWVDVIPDQSIDLGTIDFGGLTARNCPRLFSSSWTHDGSQLLYIYREPTRSVGRWNNLWLIGAHAPVTTLGERLLDMSNYPTRDQPYRIVSALLAERSTEMLFVELNSNRIYHGDILNPASHTFVDLGRCPAIHCTVLEVAWLPDGSGFVFSRYELLQGGGLYRYDFATGQSSEIVRIPGEAIGKLSIAPDGQVIVFERGPRLDDSNDRFYWGPRVLCPCQLWTVGSDGSNLQMLVEDGRAPAWSPPLPDVPVTD